MKKTYLSLSDKDKNCLKSLSKKRTIQTQIVDCARSLLYNKTDEMTFQEIADKLTISTATVRLCISKFRKGGVDATLFDIQRSEPPSEITGDAKAWMISIACQRPTELGYAQKLLPPSTNTFKSMQRRRDIQDFQQLQSHISRNFSRNRILSHLKSSFTAKNGTLILNQKCMRFCWFTSRLKCSLMKLAHSLFQMIIN